MDAGETSTASFRAESQRLIPAEAVKELTRRRFQRSYVLMANSLADGALMLGAIIRDPYAAPADRIRAFELALNRVVGKPKETVELDINSDGALPAWQQLIATAIVGTEDQAKKLLSKNGKAESGDEIIEGEIVESRPIKRDRKKHPDRQRTHRAQVKGVGGRPTKPRRKRVG